MYRSRFTVVLLILAALGPADCLCAQEPGAAVSASGAQDYTLRLVFDGLIALAPAQEADAKKAIWVLVGNASDPSQLTVGSNMPPHMSHLFVRVKDAAGVEEARISGRTLNESLPMNGVNLPGTWRGIGLQGEDLRLVLGSKAARSQAPLEVMRRPRHRLRPCNPKHWFLLCWNAKAKRQHENFAWTVNLPASLADLAGKPEEKQLKECLTREKFDCPGPHLLLNGRLKLEGGRVFVSRFVGELDSTERPNYHLLRFALATSRRLYRPRAQARQVTAEFRVQGPVKILSTPLGGSDKEEPISIVGTPGGVLEIRLMNHPACIGQDCDTFGSDFLFNFNLLKNPLFVPLDQLPVPAGANQHTRESDVSDPNFNAHCSPTSYIPEGGGNL